jgi:polyisoprenoid-binding protein YceI
MPRETKWVIDRSHSEISFKIRHLMISYVTGSFKVFDAFVFTEGNNFATAEIDLWIDPASITTNDEKRDAHLKSVEFFDVASYPQLTFRAMAIEKNEAGEFEVWGDLTIKGITRQVKLNVNFGGIAKDPGGNDRAGFEVSGVIDRKEWNLHWNSILETGGLLLGDEIYINCNIELVKQANEKVQAQAAASALADENIKAE